MCAIMREENGEVYVGAMRLTAGDEDLNLVHGDADPLVWSSTNFVDCDEHDGAFCFSVYFYTGATKAHWERPMYAATYGPDGTVHCDYHRLDGTTA